MPGMPAGSSRVGMMRVPGEPRVATIYHLWACVTVNQYTPQDKSGTQLQTIQGEQLSATKDLRSVSAISAAVGFAAVVGFTAFTSISVTAPHHETADQSTSPVIIYSLESVTSVIDDGIRMVE